MKNFKNILSLTLFVAAINTYSAQQQQKTTPTERIMVKTALEKKQRILQAVNLLASDQIPAKTLVDDYHHQESLIKKYEATNNPEIIKIINEKNTKMYNSIPNIDKAIQKISLMQTAPKTNITTHKPLQVLQKIKKKTLYKNYLQ